jgi:hypothetical protein
MGDLKEKVLDAFLSLAALLVGLAFCGIIGFGLLYVLENTTESVYVYFAGGCIYTGVVTLLGRIINHVSKGGVNQMELKDFERYKYKYRVADSCSICSYSSYNEKRKLVCSQYVTPNDKVERMHICDLFERLEF